MSNLTILSRRLRIVIDLIKRGVESDEQVASVAGLNPYNDLTVIDYVRRIRTQVTETVDLRYPIYCNHHRGRITQIPCLTCNHPDYANLPLSVSVRGPDWEQDKHRIAQARKKKAAEDRKKRLEKKRKTAKKTTKAVRKKVAKKKELKDG